MRSTTSVNNSWIGEKLMAADAYGTATADVAAVAPRIRYFHAESTEGVVSCFSMTSAVILNLFGLCPI
jgi:hypothetical protein